MSISIRILIAIFLIAHGFIHASLSWVPTPQPGQMRTPFFPAWWRADVDRQWPAAKLGMPDAEVRTVGWMLWLIATAACVVAGLALVFVPGASQVWMAAGAVSAIASLILLAGYWHPWLPVGVLIDLLILASLALRIPAPLYQ